MVVWQGVSMDSLKFHPGAHHPQPFYALQAGTTQTDLHSFWEGGSPPLQDGAVAVFPFGYPYAPLTDQKSMNREPRASTLKSQPSYRETRCVTMSL